MIKVKATLRDIFLSFSLWFLVVVSWQPFEIKGQENLFQPYKLLAQNGSMLNAPNIVFHRQKNLIVYQTVEIYRGIDAMFPVKKMVTRFLRHQNDDWEITSMHFSDGATDLILIGSDAKGNVLLFTDSKNRSKLYILELTNKRTPMPKPVENFNNGGFPIHSATLNQQGNVIIFSSARFGTKGGYDLFITELTSERRAVQIINARSAVNSPFDEIFPQFSDDNLHLFFATNFTTPPNDFQLVKARFEKGQIIPISILTSTNPSLRSVCRYQPIDTMLALITTFDQHFGFSHRFISERFSIEELKNNFSNIESKEPRWRMTRLQGYINASVSEPVEVCLLDLSGNILASTQSQSARWSFPNSPTSKFFVTFSSSKIYPTMSLLEIPDEYRYPVYVFDISLEKRKYPNSGYASVFDPNSLSPLQQFEIKSFINQYSNHVSATVFAEPKTISQNIKLFQNSTIEIQHFNIVIKPLILFFASPSNLAEPNRCLLIETKASTYPAYTVKSWLGQFASESLSNQYTIIVGKTGETDPYSLISLATHSNFSVFYNPGLETEYCLGSFSNVNQALSMIKNIRKKGFPNATLGWFDPKENRYVKIAEDTKSAKNNNSKSNRSFFIEIYASTSLIPLKTFPFSEKLCLVVDTNGVFHYIYEVETYPHATAMIEELKKQGYGSATIVSIETEDLK